MLFFWRVEEFFEHLKYDFAILLSIVSPTIVKVSLNCTSLTKQIVFKSVCFLWLPHEWWAFLFIQECLLNAPEPLAVKNLPADLGLIPGLGRSPGGGHGYPLQHSCLENPTDRGAWSAAVHESESQIRLKRLTLSLVVKTCASCWRYAKMRKPYLACALKKFPFLMWKYNYSR